MNICFSSDIVRVAQAKSYNETKQRICAVICQEVTEHLQISN